MATNWTKIKNDYLNGNISYRDLAIKHKVGYSALKTRAVKEKWFDQRKQQRQEITKKLGQKTADVIVDREFKRIMKIQDATDDMVDYIIKAMKEMNIVAATDKMKYSKTIVDKATGKNIKVYVEEEVPKSVKLSHADAQKIKILSSALKDLHYIQSLKNNEDTANDDATSINITISAATKEDMEEE